MTIGQRIKARRKELRISADELAVRLGKDRSTVYRYEKGDIENMPLDILEPIADALDTSVAYIMGWEEKKEPTVIDDGLTEGHKRLIQFAMSLSEEEAALALRMMKAIVEGD